MSRFPHLSGAPEAFGPGRELFEQIPGQFDQSRWADAVAHGKLMSVPWCGDYDNVVRFSDEAARDAWLDEAGGLSFDTRWRRPPEESYKVEVPYTSALSYNYLVLDFPMPTSDERPLPNATPRYSRLCYFVTDMRPSAGSTTELFIDVDVWTTFAYSLDVRYVQLAQGHAPMAEVSAEDFLDDPIGTSAHLLVPDVAGGAPTLPASAHAAVLDDSTLAVIITTGRMPGSWGDWGGKYGITPSEPLTFVGVTGGPDAWAISANEVNGFLNDAHEQLPNFLQTIRCVASVPASMVSLGEEVTFCGHTLRRAVPQARTLALMDVTREDFGYDPRYADIAKLYTGAYARIELTDETGAVTSVAVEDTTGTLDVTATLSLAWPYVAIDTSVGGIGSGADRQVLWHVLERPGAVQLVGGWYDTLRSHDVPIFAVRETSATSYDWSAHWTNAQRQLAADNAYASATDTSQTMRTNASNSAANVTANNAVSVAAANEITARNVAAASQGAIYSTNKLTQDVASDLNSMYASLIAEQATLAVAATNNDAKAGAAASTTVLTGIAELGASVATGNVAGAVGAVAGALASGVNTATAWESTNASISVSQSNSRDLYEAATTAASEKGAHANTYTNSATALNNTTLTNNNATQQSAATQIASNNAALINTNAENTKQNMDRNAGRERDTATSAIANDTRQAALGNPIEHGDQRPGTSGVRPMMVQATVKTAPRGIIAQAGDHMLRYGYTCDFGWEITDWCPMRNFCYWRVSDAWIVGGGNVAERYQRALKDILMRGTTVWKNPEAIGTVSIYDNL